MDRIRKALDLAREERARILMDAEDGMHGRSGRSIAERRIDPGNSSAASSIVKPVVAPVTLSERSDPAAASLTNEHLISSALATVVLSGQSASVAAPSKVGAVPPIPISVTPQAVHAPEPAPVVAIASASQGSVPAARPVAATLLPAGNPAEVIELSRFVAPTRAAPSSVTLLSAPITEAPPTRPAITAPMQEPPLPAAAIEHPKSAKLAPAAQPFIGAVGYTTTRSFTPAPSLLEAKRIIDLGRVGPAASAFRMLRTQVLQVLDERNWRSLAILSPNSEDGKTTIAANLAVSLAYDHRHTVLLVDCDLKHPGIADAFGITPEFGLDDVLTSRARVEQCLYHPEGFDRLVILPARAALANSSEALSSTRARVLARELRTRYPERIVLFDLPPILGTDDALAFLPLVDCALMVAAERATKREDLLRSMELVKRIPIIGTVLNRSTAATLPYG